MGRSKPHQIRVARGACGPRSEILPIGPTCRTDRPLTRRWNLRSRTAQALIAFGGLCACTPPGAVSPASASGPHQRGYGVIASDTINSTGAAATHGQSASPAHEHAIGAYLRAVADALLAPGANMSTVLDAAGAADVDRGNTQAYFRPPDPRLSRGILELRGTGTREGQPESFTFYCDPARAPVTVADLVTAFGPWVEGVPPTSPVPRWPIIFTTPYRGSGAPRSSADAISVTARLLGDPRRPDARVADIDLQRQRTGSK